MPKKNKEHITFDLDYITLGWSNNTVHYIVNIHVYEKSDFIDDEHWCRTYKLCIDLDEGCWAFENADRGFMLTTSDYKAVGRFVEKVLQQYGNCEVDEHDLYDKFTEEALKKVK